MSTDVLCIGELLWDALPDGLFLGGAPFNVACHLHRLGPSVAFASRIGSDELGREALRRLRARGLDPELVQTDDTRPTGFVRVDLDAETGEPDYDILEPVAWNAIEWTASLQQRAVEAEALVYGSLAQRADPSRTTIQRLFDVDAVRAFDVNLRPPHVDREVVARSLRAATLAKLNDDELDRLRDWFDLPDGAEAATARLATAFDCRAVCVTGGDAGARFWREGQYWTHPGYEVKVEDTVGAGDAFFSALLAGFLEGRDGASLLSLANRLGAYVAAHAGAVPEYQVDTLDDIGALPLSS